MEKEKKIAVLIDAENVSEKYIRHIFDEVSNHGIPTYKRIYGDWTKPNLSSWKNTLLQYSINPIQQYCYTTGKNSTDSALIIDAMDILYSKSVDGFCIVSSDSDFTRLAARLREAGMYVLGMGEKKTPKAFIASCEKFKYLEVLASSAEAAASSAPDASFAEGAAPSAPGAASPSTATDKPAEAAAEVKAGIADLSQIADAIRTIINDISDEDGWVHLSEVGSNLNKRYPDFDVRNYGFSKLTPFICSLKQFELQSRKDGKSNTSHKYIRNKVEKPPESEQSAEQRQKNKRRRRRSGKKNASGDQNGHSTGVTDGQPDQSSPAAV